MTCKKSCFCSNCEMLDRDEIVIIEQKGLSEKRKTVLYWHCGYNGTYAKNLKDLKKSNLTDNFIYI